MAIYGNLIENTATKHIVVSTSKIKATNTGHLFDLVFTEDVDNGVLAKAGAYTGNGYQEREATLAGEKDEVVLIASVPLIYNQATTSAQAEYNFYNTKGSVTRGYELVKDDVFAVSDYAFTTVVSDNVEVGNYVVCDGTGKYKEVAKASGTTLTSSNGFVGQVIGFETYQYSKLVLIAVVQNTTIA